MSETPDAIASLGSDCRSPTYAGHVAVIGAGMVGVLGARVFATYCERRSRVHRGDANQAGDSEV